MTPSLESYILIQSWCVDLTRVTKKSRMIFLLQVACFFVWFGLFVCLFVIYSSVVN